MEEFKDIVDVKAWKEVHETLYEVIKKPLCTVDIKGEEVLFSGEEPYYTKVLKTTDFGKEIIKEGRREVLRKLLNEKGKILLYYSKDGMLNIWAPIYVNEKLAGAIGCVFLLDSNKKDIQFGKIIKESNIEHDELQEAVNKIKPVSSEDINKYSEHLYTISKIVPKTLNMKCESDKELKELRSIYEITRMINSTLYLERILVNVMNFIIDLMKIKNCSIIIMEKGDVKKGFYYRKNESLKEIDAVLIKEAVSTKNIVKVHDIRRDFRFKNIKNNLSSVLSFPLKIKSEIIGIMTLYFDEKESLEKSNTDLISVIADQVSMAIFNAKEFSDAKESAAIDKLTGLYNRGHFTPSLTKMMKDVTKEDPLSLAMIDIDDFKHYNDSMGHIKGDELIKEIAELIRSETSSEEIPGRYGGEEFIVIFPGADNNKAIEKIENIRRKVEGLNSKITISAGLVTCMDDTIEQERLIELADKALYKSKIGGKNKVTNVLVLDKNLPEIDVGKV